MRNYARLLKWIIDHLDWFWAIFWAVTGEPGYLPCRGPLPEEPPAQGDHRLWTYIAQNSETVVDVAISNGGYRAVAGDHAGNVYYFDRTQEFPRFKFNLAQSVNAVDMSDRGETFVVGGFDGNIYFFKCDQSLPAWTYNAGQDESSGTAVIVDVCMEKDGRWIGAVSKTHVYLFRWDSNTPVLKRQIDQDRALATVAITDSGRNLVVGTLSDLTQGGCSKVYYLNRNDVLWDYSIPDYGWGPIDLPTAVSISSDGTAIAAGARDGKVYFFKSSVSTPQWSYDLESEYVVYSVSLSSDGQRLAVIGAGKLFFFDQTSTPTPTFIYEGNYDVNFFGVPHIYPGNDNEPNANYGIGTFRKALAMSRDGNYLATSTWNEGRAFSHYREFAEPFRMYNTPTPLYGLTAVHLSSDGSWVMLGGEDGTIQRYEVAPALFVKAQMELTYNVVQVNNEQTVQVIGGTEFDIDYWLVKPGRAATLQEYWRLWLFVSGAFVPPIEWLTQSQFEWTYNHTLANNNQIITGTRVIPAPQFLSGIDVASVNLFIIQAELFDIPSHNELSDDQTVTANVTASSGPGNE